MYVLVGAGGHAKVITDILQTNKFKIKGFIDDYLTEKTFMGYSLLGKTEDIPAIIESEPSLRFIISVGSNTARRHLVDKISRYGVMYGKVVHPSAVISNLVTIGDGTVIMPNSVINADTQIGSHCIINSGAIIEHECRLQDFVHVSPGALLAGSVKVGKGTHIGIGAKVIQNIEIGSNATVGAGAVIIRNVFNNTKVVGVPAREII
ncbi:acetyltransferase [Metabacillus sp. HB246100]